MPHHSRLQSCFRRIVCCAGLILTGLLSTMSSVGLADEEATVAVAEISFPELSPDTMVVFARANRAINDLDGFLRATGYEKPAFIGVNYFAVSVGGIDALRDLEENRGVDPETFAALYAGFAIPSVAEHLNLEKSTNAEGRLKLTIAAADGRLRYKGAVVRMYSPERLRSLFLQRSAFRTESERQRRKVFSDYVFSRRRQAGELGSGGQEAEVTDMDDRYTRLQPLLIELENRLRADASASSVLAGIGSHHYFGYSVGGIDVLSDLNNRRAVDPETFAAIYAGHVSADYAEAFKITPAGRILYQDVQVKMYSPKLLEACFKHRETLELRIGR